ncbi:MAG TPA: F0F1 ATP synthase subunit B [Vicinamibacterales bacterium]|nr:F0F1 ATP synthase subunit B [Vicinamibacterales bacterium]
MDNPLVQPDPGLFIWTIATFLVLAWALKRFAWVPLLSALAEREKTIASAVEHAEQAKAELEKVQAQSAGMLAEARREASDLVNRARVDADRFREEMRQKAAGDAASITRNAELQIQRETAKALEQIRREAVDLSLAVASKLIQRNLSKADNEQLIQDTVRQVGESRH